MRHMICTHLNNLDKVVVVIERQRYGHPLAIRKTFLRICLTLTSLPIQRVFVVCVAMRDVVYAYPGSVEICELVPGPKESGVHVNGSLFLFRSQRHYDVAPALCVVEGFWVRL